MYLVFWTTLPASRGSYSIKKPREFVHNKVNKCKTLFIISWLFWKKYRILSQGSNFNFFRNYCLRVDRHESVTKHQDFLVCPGTTISSTTKRKLWSKSLEISKQDLQFYERLGEFFGGNSRTISDCRVSSIKKYFPAAKYLDTM